MGVCDSRELNYVPIACQHEKVVQMVECEVGSPPLMSIQASLRSISSISQMSTPSLNAEAIPTMRISCPRSLPTKKRDPSFVSCKYEKTHLFPRAISIPTSIGEWGKRRPFSALSPSRSKSVGSINGFPWDDMCSMESQSSRTSESSRRRSLSSLLRGFVEDEQILLATLFVQVATPRAKSCSVCLFE